jgi:TPR repeat protein
MFSKNDEIVLAGEEEQLALVSSAELLPAQDEIDVGDKQAVAYEKIRESVAEQLTTTLPKIVNGFIAKAQSLPNPFSRQVELSQITGYVTIMCNDIIKNIESSKSASYISEAHYAALVEQVNSEEQIIIAHTYRQLCSVQAVSMAHDAQAQLSPNSAMDYMFLQWLCRTILTEATILQHPMDERVLFMPHHCYLKQAIIFAEKYQSISSSAWAELDPYEQGQLLKTAIKLQFDIYRLQKLGTIKLNHWLLNIDKGILEFTGGATGELINSELFEQLKLLVRGSSLSVINLAHSGLSTKDGNVIEQLAQFIGNCRELKVLILSNNIYLGDNGLEKLQRVLATHPNLLELRLDNTGLTSSAGNSLGVILKESRSLAVLSLYGCQLGDKGIVRLAAHINAHSHLRALNVGENGVTAIGIKALVNSAMSPNLTKLVLSNNSIKDEGAELLFNTPLLMSRLTELALSNCDLSKKSIQSLRFVYLNANHKHIYYFENLEKLNLSNNAIGDKGIYALLKAIEVFAKKAEEASKRLPLTKLRLDNTSAANKTIRPETAEQLLHVCCKFLPHLEGIPALSEIREVLSEQELSGWQKRVQRNRARIDRADTSSEIDFNRHDAVSKGESSSSCSSNSVKTASRNDASMASASVEKNKEIAVFNPQCEQWIKEAQSQQKGLKPQVALDLLEKACAAGYPLGWYEVACAYMPGNFFGLNLHDEETSIELFNKIKVAARKGNAIAEYALGLMHEKGIGVERDIRMALSYYRRSAEQGYSAAQNEVARSYERGEDYKKAAKWYRRSAEQGDAKGQFSLGRLYQENRINSHDYYDNLTEAVLWYQEAVIGGEKAARDRLDFLKDSALKDSGHREAKYAYGKLRLTYTLMGNADNEIAYNYLKRAADQGHLRARHYLEVTHGESNTKQEGLVPGNHSHVIERNLDKGKEEMVDEFHGPEQDEYGDDDGILRESYELPMHPDEFSSIVNQNEEGEKGKEEAVVSSPSFFKVVRKAQDNEEKREELINKAGELALAKYSLEKYSDDDLQEELNSLENKTNEELEAYIQALNGHLCRYNK